GGGRTHTSRGTRDFESRASASSATPAAECDRSGGSSAEERAGDFVPLSGARLQLTGRLLERDVDDRVAVEGRHAPEVPLIDELGRLEAEHSGGHAVPRGRRPP